MDETTPADKRPSTHHGNVDGLDQLRKRLDNLMEEAIETMRRLPPEREAGFRSEFNSLAARSLDILGDNQDAVLARREPACDLYRTRLAAEEKLVSGAATKLDDTEVRRLKEGVAREASAAGLDGVKVAERMGRGAANALEEREWIKADLAKVAETRGFDLARPEGRREAAGIVDRFYEKAGTMLAEVRGVRLESEPDLLRTTLQTMARMEGRQGGVRFESPEDARRLAEDMKVRYGETIVKDLARGKTDALARDFAGSEERAKIAQAVVSAAVKEEAFGLSSQEISAARERMSTRSEHEVTRGRRTDRDLER